MENLARRAIRVYPKQSPRSNSDPTTYCPYRKKGAGLCKANFLERSQGLILGKSDCDRGNDSGFENKKKCCVICSPCSLFFFFFFFFFFFI